jgi:hypothetical protein
MTQRDRGVTLLPSLPFLSHSHRYVPWYFGGLLLRHDARGLPGHELDTRGALCPDRMEQ